MSRPPCSVCGSTRHTLCGTTVRGSDLLLPPKPTTTRDEQTDVTIDTQSLLALTHQLAAALRLAMHMLETPVAHYPMQAPDFSPLDNAWDRYNEMLGDAP